MKHPFRKTRRCSALVMIPLIILLILFTAGPGMVINNVKLETSIFGLLMRYTVARCIFAGLMMLLCSFLAFMIVIFISLKEEGKLKDTLLVHCEAYRYLEAYSYLLSQAGQNKNQRYLINYGTALAATGDLEGAIRATNTALECLRKKKPSDDQVVCYSNLSIYYARLGRLDEAELALEQAKQILRSQNRSEPLCYDHIFATEMFLMFRKGMIREVLPYYLKRCEFPRNHYSAANDNFTAAQIYEQLGDVEAQKRHLQVTAELGGSLHIATFARQKLQQLG